MTGTGAGSITSPWARAAARGIGRALVGAAEAWLCRRGVRKAQLMVRRSNIGVVAFYDRLGFEEAEVVVMQRRLDRT